MPDISPRGIPVARSSSDRKSTRLNSSHANISYAVFCLKKHCRNSAQIITPFVRVGTHPFCNFVFNDTATTEIYTLSLHDALPIYFVLRIVRFHESVGVEQDGVSGHE